MTLVQFNYLYNLLIFKNLTEINEMILTEKNLKRDHHPLGALALRCKNKILKEFFLVWNQVITYVIELNQCLFGCK